MSEESAFLACKSAWRKMVEQAIKAKFDFQSDADECMRFFNGPYDFLYGLNDSPMRGDFLYVGRRNMHRPSICMTVNKVAEGVQLFGPSLYHKNPICNVNPRKPPDIPLDAFGDMKDPQVQQAVQPVIQQLQQQQQIDAIRSALIHGYLNYLPTAINLKQSSRDCIDETIIKGGGVLWAEMKMLPGGQKMPTLVYDSIDNLQVDPDHESIDAAKWVMRRRVCPTWEKEKESGLPYGTLRGNYESHSQYAAVEAAAEQYKRKQGKTNDLLVYWQCWSKMGIGGLLRGISPDAVEIDRFGQYAYIEFCESYDHFLNVPPAIWGNEEEMRRRVQWETPFWCDSPTSNGWPMTMFAFHKVPRQVWPMSHFRPAMGELKFINWAYSFLISGMQKRSRDFIVLPMSIEPEVEEKILEGDDLTVLKLSQSMGVPVDQIVKFIEHPGFPEWQFKVIQAVENNFDKRTGMSELMYGLQQTQDRSATETQTKENYANLRPDDMANSVEDAMTDCFRKLALMSRWHMSGDDIGKIYGPIIGNLWAKYVATADVAQIIHQLEYRIEAGSSKKPNKAREQGAAQDMMQQLLPVLQASGSREQVNALITFWGKAFDMDVAKMLLPEPTPPHPEPPKVSVALKGEDIMSLQLGDPIREVFGLPPTGQQQPNPQVQQMVHSEADHQQEARHADEMHKLKMKHEKEKAAQQKKKAASNGKK